MQIDIRPRSIGENFSLIFQLVGRHFFVLLIIQTILTLPNLGLTIWSETPDVLADDGLTMIAGLGILLLYAVFTPIATGASIVIVAGSFIGQRATLGDAFAVAFRRMLPLLGYAFVVGLLTFAGLLALIVPGMIVMTVYFVGNCAVVLEERGVGRAMSRSADLTRGRRWNVFALVLVVSMIIQFVPQMVVAIVFGVIGAASGEMTDTIRWSAVLVEWAIGVVATLFYVVAPIVVYFSLRAEKDGFDVEQLATLVDEIGDRGDSGSL